MPRDKLTLSLCAGLIATTACASTTQPAASTLGVPNLTVFTHRATVEPLHLPHTVSRREQARTHEPLWPVDEPRQVRVEEPRRSAAAASSRFGMREGSARGASDAREMHVSAVPETDDEASQLQPTTTASLPSPAAEDARACERAVFFDTASTRLDRGSRRRLDRVAECLQDHGVTQATVIGRTDARGSARYNAQLGLERARAVAAYLQTRGIAEEQLRVRSQGELAAVESEVLWPVDRTAGVHVESR